ncbi:flagellar biosynthesis protein FlhS [Cytobacillus depressus]|uniref:Flagellar biosynthesis protein FlhS n=1 Tax=Cytobacillus depressus TaxID=1602942 RepID=A0A6L3V6M5_9BACI|nr:EscU/YscU/HrcU family type III secretion system export apparatus switch protein [Cytobacillus depressus]KAB2336798.1 flagellar biosynthesis protein FlhS [Cytobacillus depressus]
MIPRQNIRKPFIGPSLANPYNNDEERNSTNEAEQFAQKMIDAAQKGNIQIQEDPTLLKHLIKVNLGDSVPPQLYGLISEILYFMKEIEKE